MVCHRSKVPFKELVNVIWDVVVDIHNKKMCIGVIVCDFMG